MNMSYLTPRWRHALFITLLILLLAALGAPAAAQATPDTPPADAPASTAGANAGSAATLAPDPDSLVFSGAAGDALGRTLTLKAVGGAVSNVRISAGDLLGDPGQQALLASKITISPAEVAAIDGVQVITVTVATDNVRGGVYRGALSIWYDELPDKTIPLSVAVAVTVSGAPDVSVDANSANQTLFAETKDAPFVGGAPTNEPRPLRLPFFDPAIVVRRPFSIPLLDVEIDPRTPVLGQLPIALVADNNEEARVTGAEVLPVRNSASQLTLPSGIVGVDPAPTKSKPLIIPGQGAATLDLVLRGRNLPAGAYTGNLRVWVENQSQAITVPFTMKLKDNWIYAIAVLLASFVVGAAVAWFNGRGGAARTNIDKIRKLEHQLDPDQNAQENHLQKAELSTASALLIRVMNAVYNQSEQDVINTRLQVFEDYVKGQVEAIGRVIKDLEDMAKCIEGIEAEQETCVKLKPQLDALDDTQRAGLKEQCDDLLKRINSGELDSHAAAEGEVEAIKNKVSAPMSGFVDDGASGKPRSKAQQAFDRYELKIRVGAIAVMVLAYFFALLVGWAALYLTNQTFGASPTDYLTLFLWGATVNVVAGQQIKLENIYGHKATKLPSTMDESDTPPDPNAGNGS